jgi:hypothetical protein
MRGVFWKASARRGWKWLSGITDHLGRGLLILALFGVPTASFALLDLGWLAVLAGAVVLVIAGLGEGAYQTAADLLAEISQRTLDEQDAGRLRDESFHWIATASKFLETRDALSPQPENPLATAGQRVAEREALSVHERETVALYIEHHRDQAVHLFDQLVAGGYIIDAERPRIRAPKERYAIQSTIHSIQLAAERVPRSRI